MGEPETTGTAAGVRIDKWLWAVRVYPTRTAAVEACKAGHVKVEGKNIKPARIVRLDEVIEARVGEILRTVKVRGMLERRVGAKLVERYMEDLTPEAEFRKPRDPNLQPLFRRGKGTGRPTKRDRRVLSVLSRKVREAGAE